MAAILDVVRTSLRRTSNALDANELIPLIAAAKTDLSAAGVGVVDDTDELTQAAIVLYVRWFIERDEKMRDVYELVKNGMAMNFEYEVKNE